MQCKSVQISAVKFGAVCLSAIECGAEKGLSSICNSIIWLPIRLNYFCGQGWTDGPRTWVSSRNIFSQIISSKMRKRIRLTLAGEHGDKYWNVCSAIILLVVDQPIPLPHTNTCQYKKPRTNITYNNKTNSQKIKESLWIIILKKMTQKLQNAILKCVISLK